MDNQPSEASTTEVSPLRICLILAIILLVLYLGMRLWFGFQAVKGMASWGRPEISILGGARANIVASTPLRPSEVASVFYFYIDGYREHNILISYTDSPEALAQTVKSLTGKTIDELAPFKPKKGPERHTYRVDDAQHNSCTFYEPGYTQEKDAESFRTSFYDLSSIADGKFYNFFDESKHEEWRLIIDTVKNRLYYFCAEY